MSPEQMAGGRIDGRSDIYSLGVMLFQLLTGRLPHQADSMARVMYLIANEPAPDVRSIRPELPEALANVVALALEKHPETRYADAHQLATDLREVESWLISAQAVAAHLGSSGPVESAPTASKPAVVATHPQAAEDFTATVALLRPDTRHNRKT
jgi:serine/threonine-protein kinase